MSTENFFLSVEISNQFFFSLHFSVRCVCVMFGYSFFTQHADDNPSYCLKYYYDPSSSIFFVVVVHMCLCVCAIATRNLSIPLFMASLFCIRDSFFLYPFLNCMYSFFLMFLKDCERISHLTRLILSPTINNVTVIFNVCERREFREREKMI